MKSKITFMNVAIVGSREFHNYDYVKEKVLEVIRNLSLKIEDISYIVSGGAKGVDKLAEEFAREFNIPLMIFHPEWERHGKCAGVIRNSHIVEKADVIIAFPHRTKSKGTWDTIRKAKNKGKKVFIFKVSEELLLNSRELF